MPVVQNGKRGGRIGRSSLIMLDNYSWNRLSRAYVEKTQDNCTRSNAIISTYRQSEDGLKFRAYQQAMRESTWSTGPRLTKKRINMSLRLAYPYPEWVHEAQIRKGTMTLPFTGKTATEALEDISWDSQSSAATRSSYKPFWYNSLSH